MRGAAKPQRSAGGAADLHDVVPMDGFSLIPTIVATLPSSVVKDGLPGILDDPNLSATANSATVIIDAETGAFIPHYTDKIDRGVDAEHEPIVLRTFAPLAPKHRYVVALKGVRLAPAEGAPADAAGLAPPPEGFRRLRDGAVAKDPALATMKDRFDCEVFAVLERAGIVRKDLQLAWDFTTGSEEQPRADMLRVRDLTLEWLAANTPAVTITETKPGTDRIWRTVSGTITAAALPRSAGARRAPLPWGGRARRPERNDDVRVHDQRADLGARSLRAGARPRLRARVLRWARRARGQRRKDDRGAARSRRARDRMVGDVEGRRRAGQHDARRRSRPRRRLRRARAPGDGELARRDGGVPRPAHEGAGADAPGRGWQGVVVGPGGASNAGQLVYDPSFIGYFGASQGHILGGTLAALNPDFSRVVLNVGGGGFTHIMPRSANFGPFSIVLDVTFKDELMVQAYIAMFQRPLNRIDPITYAPLVSAAPERRVLLQVGLGDAQVPNAGSYLHARALGVKLSMPSPANVFGLESVTAADGASALTLFDFGIDTRAYATPSPLGENEVHEGVRVNAAALRQMDEFLRPGGTIIHPCDGPCDPE